MLSEEKSENATNNENRILNQEATGEDTTAYTNKTLKISQENHKLKAHWKEDQNT